MVITDYPDAPLIKNISRNVERNLGQDLRRAVDVQVSKGKANRVMTNSLTFCGLRVTSGEQILKNFSSRSNLALIVPDLPAMWITPEPIKSYHMDLMS